MVGTAYIVFISLTNTLKCENNIFYWQKNLIMNTIWLWLNLRCIGIWHNTPQNNLLKNLNTNLNSLKSCWEKFLVLISFPVAKAQYIASKSQWERSFVHNGLAPRQEYHGGRPGEAKLIILEEGNSDQMWYPRLSFHEPFRHIHECVLLTPWAALKPGNLTHKFNNHTHIPSKTK